MTVRGLGKRRRLLLMAVVALALVVPPFRTPNLAGAGDVWTNNGDCWRGGTVICRMGWSANATFKVQWTNYMPSGETTLLNTAIDAMNTWNNAAGPQYQAFNPNPSPTRVYLYATTILGYGAADATNYDTNGRLMPFQGGTGTIAWTDIRMDVSNRSNPTVKRIWLHEFGHALALGHHVNENRGVMWPYSNQFQYDAPTDFDIGPKPPCSGITSSYLGLRCIYNYGQ